MALTLYSHPLSSFCWKVIIALYENGAPFEAKMVNLGDPAERAAFAGLWPTAKIPLLTDGDRVVPETSIQMEYIDSRHPGQTALLPADPEARLEARLWDRLFDSYVMRPMGDHIDQLLRPEAHRDAHALAESVEKLKQGYDLIESRIGDRPWAAGETFTIADCAAAPSLFYGSTVRAFGPEHRKLSAYFERLMARPSVARTIAEARPVFHFYPLAEKIPARFRGEPADAG